MYRRILVALEHSAADAAILSHATDLARLSGAALLLVHVADGWAARNFDRLNLRESEEMKEDRAYLERVQTELTGGGLTVEVLLAKGDPADQLIRVAEECQVDLIAMSTHGHRFIADVLYGTTVNKVRHLVKIPVLLVRAH